LVPIIADVIISSYISEVLLFVTRNFIELNGSEYDIVYIYY
jgi:hypothetical protein